MSSSDNIKRQRTTSSNNEIHIANLPDGILVGISSYLAKPSLALFAIAISSNNSQRTQTSKIILSSTDWEVLDFDDIEKSLAKQISDDHIDKMLKSIDAVNNLKILKLAGCVNMTGSGLDVLRSSVAIEQIDMSLVGKNEVPLIEPEPLLSESLVIPILDDIISRGNSLTQLELPKKWRNAHSIRFTLFLGRYNNYLARQRHRCLKCDRICEEVGDHDEWITLTPQTRWYGTQHFTCTQCLKHICWRDECGDDTWCKKCEKLLCQECSPSTKCSQCYYSFCNACDEMKHYPSVIIGVDPPILCGQCAL